MLDSKRLPWSTNVRGALVLGALLAAIFLIAIAVSVWIYKQLDQAADVQQTLVDAELRLDELVRIQLEQEAGLRGYLASGEATFLETYSGRGDDYAGALADFAKQTAELQIPELASLIAELGRVHEQWERQVARPLLASPHAPYALTRETLGKVYVDQLRGDTARVHKLLVHSLSDVQNQLKQRIKDALAGGLGSILIFAVVCIVFVSSRQQMLATIDRERSIVETLQGAFRADLDTVPGSRLGTAYISADSDAAVGGDLYDVRRIGKGRGLVIVADVSGKGIEAAVNTAFVKYSVRTLARTYEDPAEILSQFNRIFLDTVDDPNLFVVAFVGVLDTAKLSLTYASAGHSVAYLRRGLDVQQLEVTGPIVGLDPSVGYGSRVLPLERGDLLVLATDGLTEARDRAGGLLEDLGAMSLLRLTSIDPQSCADELIEAVRARGDGAFHDDLALLVIAIDGKAA
jgi:serine phosphatase RsbU (regulator of sigma subunit)